MARRGSLYALACAEDSRTEAFEALRVPARMLGVRKGGLGVKVSLLGKELMLASQCPGAQETPLGGMPCASVCHAATATRLGRSVADEGMRSIKEDRNALAWRESREFKDSSAGRVAGREETLPMFADCWNSAVVSIVQS